MVFGLATKLKVVDIREILALPLPLILEWAAYLNLQDPRTKEDIELQVAQEQSDAQKTTNLFDLLRGITPGKKVKNGK